MGSICDSGIHCVRDYRGVTTQKQMTRFFKEFCGIKTANAYKQARDFYRKAQNCYKYKPDLFFIFCDDYCKVYENGEFITGKFFI